MREEEARILAAEKEFFKSRLPELLTEHAGQWALVKDQAVHGLFKEGAEAYAAGVQHFGPSAVFLVAPIRPDFDAPVDIPALATGLIHAHF